MKSFADLKKAILDKKILVWNDPDPIPGNDYVITWINEHDLEDEDSLFPILIQYGSGSEAQVFLHEILVVEEDDAKSIHHTKLKNCTCEFCLPMDYTKLETVRFIVCSECGNKRCPKAIYHGYKCTNNNELNQTPTYE